MYMSLTKPMLDLKVKQLIHMFPNLLFAGIVLKVNIYTPFTGSHGKG